MFRRVPREEGRGGWPPRRPHRSFGVVEVGGAALLSAILVDARDIGAGEVVALEQERLAGGPGECVGEDVAEIEAGGVAPLAVAAERVAGAGCLIGRDGCYLGRRQVEETLEQPPSGLALAALDDDRDLDQRDGGDEALLVLLDEAGEGRPLGLVEQDGQNGRLSRTISAAGHARRSR